MTGGKNRCRVKLRRMIGRLRSARNQIKARRFAHGSVHQIRRILTSLARSPINRFHLVWIDDAVGIGGGRHGVNHGGGEVHVRAIAGHEPGLRGIIRRSARVALAILPGFVRQRAEPRDEPCLCDAAGQFAPAFRRKKSSQQHAAANSIVARGLVGLQPVFDLPGERFGVFDLAIDVDGLGCRLCAFLEILQDFFGVDHGVSLWLTVKLRLYRRKRLRASVGLGGWVMAKIHPKRMTAEIDGDFVVFLIGMRINKPWKPWKWLPPLLAMPKMLIELGKKPELGLLHARSHFGLRSVLVVQYWRSFDQLHAYATDRSSAHLPAWHAFNKAVDTNGDVGIWHETFLVRAGEYENIYGNMPTYGMGFAGDLYEATGRRRSARGRLKQTDGADQPPT